jgi:hypothetical protein
LKGYFKIFIWKTFFCKLRAEDLNEKTARIIYLPRGFILWNKCTRSDKNRVDEAKCAIHVLVLLCITTALEISQIKQNKTKGEQT